MWLIPLRRPFLRLVYVVSDVLAFSRSLDVDSNGNAEPELSAIYILSDMDK